MNSILLSTQECGSQELLQLTEMLCREQDFQIIVSRAFPFMEKENKNRRKQGGRFVDKARV